MCDNSTIGETWGRNGSARATCLMVHSVVHAVFRCPSGPIVYSVGISQLLGLFGFKRRCFPSLGVFLPASLRLRGHRCSRLGRRQAAGRGHGCRDGRGKPWLQNGFQRGRPLYVRLISHRKGRSFRRVDLRPSHSFRLEEGTEGTSTLGR